MIDIFSDKRIIDQIRGRTVNYLKKKPPFVRSEFDDCLNYVMFRCWESISRYDSSKCAIYTYLFSVINFALAEWIGEFFCNGRAAYRYRARKKLYKMIEMDIGRGGIEDPRRNQGIDRYTYSVDNSDFEVRDSLDVVRLVLEKEKNPRILQVYDLMRQGLTVRQIAEHLHLHVVTIRYHQKKIMSISRDFLSDVA